ncbi:hypothetical protein [Streptomyces microflavus]|uniref:hypothetical protein n=1 Tax=Streptomyces microflavus TaxID=1919 RepID=UPI0036E301DC
MPVLDDHLTVVVDPEGRGRRDAGSFDYASRSGLRTRQFTFKVTVGATGPVALTEHDGSAWADRGDLPAVSDETRALLAG